MKRLDEDKENLKQVSFIIYVNKIKEEAEKLLGKAISDLQLRISIIKESMTNELSIQDYNSAARRPAEHSKLRKRQSTRKDFFKSKTIKNMNEILTMKGKERY